MIPAEKKKEVDDEGLSQASARKMTDLVRHLPMQRPWQQPFQQTTYSLGKEAKVMDGVRVQPGFGKRQSRVSIDRSAQEERDHQQRRCKPSSGAGSGSETAFCHPDR